MFIAFEGADDTGKSTSARNLDCAQQPDYNVTKAMHAQNVAEQEPGTDMPHTYDRIDWFSHMVYRLAMPEKDWNDDRPRTVFAMPDTHLVVKLHHPDLANFTVAADPEDAATANRTRGVETPVGRVNPMYYYFADFFSALNEQRNYALFQTVSLVEVMNNPTEGTFSQRLVQFSSPVLDWNLGTSPEVDTDDKLLELLHAEQQAR